MADLDPSSLNLGTEPVIGTNPVFAVGATKTQSFIDNYIAAALHLAAKIWGTTP